MNPGPDLDNGSDKEIVLRLGQLKATEGSYRRLTSGNLNLEAHLDWCQYALAGVADGGQYRIKPQIRLWIVGRALPQFLLC